MEAWKPVVGYEGRYSVSNYGRIRSEARTMRHSRNPRSFVSIDEKILILTPNSKGYLSFTACRNGKSRTLKVHTCVLEAFTGPCPSGLQARHLDGVKTRNVVSNLKWGTHHENHQDRVRHGTIASGEKQGLAKLDAGMVLQIRNSKESNSELAKRFGVHRSTVRLARSGRTWRHV